jgi:3-oxoadipyl-CoA thiolase
MEKIGVCEIMIVARSWCCRAEAKLLTPPGALARTILTSLDMSDTRDVFLCDGVRTPIGRYGGALAKVRTDDLAAVPIRALINRHPEVDWSALDEVVLGCANQAGEDNRNVARMALLLAGLPDSVPGVTVNRLCASGLNAIGDAARAIRCGEAELAIAGGVESMTRAPLVMGKAQEAFQRGGEIHDTTLGWRFVNPVLKAQYGIESMAETGENVAEDYQVSRADQDAFALRSQQRAGKAMAAGYFAEEIVPVEVRGKDGVVTVAKDEHPRSGTTLEALAKLKPIVREGGTITAGNASGVNDGAAAVILASETAAKRHGFTPRARVLGMASAAVPPRVMGIGPVPATRKLMARLGLKMGDFDLIEINEAFASQGLACLRQLGVADAAEHVNPHGGAIALGHPLGMSGARLALTAVHGLEKRDGKLALATMCVGVGQGVSLALERI